LSHQQQEDKIKQRQQLEQVLKYSLGNINKNMKIFKEKRTKEMIQEERKEKGKQMLTQ